MPTLVQRPPSKSAAARRRPVSRLKILLAVLAAALLHVVLIVFLAWGLPRWPRHPLRKGIAPITLTIQPSGPSDTPVPQNPDDAAKHSDYIRTPDDRKSDTTPEKAPFESHQDTLAASEKPPDDQTKPLPTQDGREMSAFQFDTNPYRPGDKASDSASAASAATAEEQPTPGPTPAKQRKPDPHKPAAQPTPRPNSAQPTPTPGEFVTLKPDASPSDTPPEPQASPTPKAESTPPTSVQDALAAQAARVRQENPSISSTGVPLPPGYQPQTIQTKMSGSVDNHGRSSVDARGTPLGRYEKAISDAIGALWYYNVDRDMDKLVHTGEVQIHFFVTRNGKVINARVNGRNQNSTLADISMEAVNEAELPPIPPDVAAMLPGGQLEVDYSFGMFER